MEQQQDIFTDEIDKSLLAAFAWWEKRRLAYNIAVGVTGVIIVFWLRYFSFLDFFGILVYGVIANLFYCLGFLTEVAARHYFKSHIDFTSKRDILFRLGISVSVLITLGIGLIFIRMQQNLN